MSLDYHPLLPGLTLYYVYVGYDSPEPLVESLVWDVEEVRAQSGVETARISTRRGGRPPEFHELRRDSKGLWRGSSLEIKLPAVAGDSWTVAGEVYPIRNVHSLSARVFSLAREFEGCLEVGLANEDTGSGSRFYAPGVGLVLERWSGERSNGVLSLTHWVRP